MEPVIITNIILGIFLFFVGVLSSVAVVNYLLPKDVNIENNNEKST
jgi:uncharacterized membrane protein YgaE (UPF0421/DUF939 family)